MSKISKKNKVEEIELDTSQFKFNVPDDAVLNKFRDLEGLSAEMYQQDRLKSKADALEGDLKTQKELLSKKEAEFKNKLEKERAKLESLSKEDDAKSKWPLVILALTSFVLILGVLYWRMIGFNISDEQIVVDDEPADTQVEVPSGDVQTEPAQQIIVPVQGSDIDSDGLTDIEERIYMVDTRNPDSDGDSFLDGNEVFHRYDPGLETPALLRFSDAIQVYEHDGLIPFSILAPQSWTIQPPLVTGQGIERPEELFDGIQIRTNTRSIIRLEFYDRAGRDIRDWLVDYLDFKGVDNGVDLFVTKEGYSGYESQDKRIVAIEVDSYIMLAEYDLVSDRTIEYLTTFKMMLNSFEID